MEAFPSSRAQRPAHSRAQGAAGNLRLPAILRVLLSLLAALLGHRNAARHGTLPACDTAQAWWIALPDSESEPALADILPCELPLQLRRLLYLFGARRNRGMRTHPRALPTPRAHIARGPPMPALTPKNPNQRQIAPTRGR